MVLSIYIKFTVGGNQAESDTGGISFLPDIYFVHAL